MKKFAILTLALAMALPASAAGVTIGGYIDIGWASLEGGRGVGLAGARTLGPVAAATNGNSSATGEDGFALNEVNIDLNAQLTNDISAFASLDFTGNGGQNSVAAGQGTTAAANATNVGDVSVDYAYVDFANPGPFDLNLRAGRIPSVFGIEQRASESPQTKFVNLSHLSPLTVGATDGVAIYGTFSPINYAFSLSNADIRGPITILNPGTQAGGQTGAVPVLRPGNNNGSANTTTNNDNNALALAGRIGLVPIEGLEIGASYSTSQWLANGAGAANQNPDVDRTQFGLDASYSWGAFTVKGEYLDVQEEQPNQALGVGDAEMTAYYAEVMYDFSSKYSVGARYNNSEVKQGGVRSDYNTISVAGVYRVADNVHLKAEYDFNEEDTLQGSNANPRIENDVFAVSLVGVF